VEPVHHAAQANGEVEAFPALLEAPGLDACQVQDVAHHAEEPIGVLLRDAEQLLRQLRSHVLVHQHVQGALDGRERRVQVVRDHGQQLGPHLVHVLQPPVQRGEVPDLAGEVRHILQDEEVRAVGRRRADGREGDPDDPAPAVELQRLAGARRAGRQRRDRAVQQGGVLAAEELHHRLAQQRRGRAAQDLRGRPVGADDAPPAVHLDDPLAHGVEQPVHVLAQLD